MSMNMLISIGAALISALAAVYARWAVGEAKKANDIGRLNALLALRQHYLELIGHQVKWAEQFKNSPGGLQAARKEYEDLDIKLREVSTEVGEYHQRLVANRP